jgi:proline dehydrogenase
MRAIMDYTNENHKDHKSNFNEISTLTHTFKNETIAVKLSSLNVDNQSDVENYLDQIMNISVKNNNTVLIDAEDYKIQDKINAITDNFMEQYNRDKLRIYKTYQLYRNDYLDIMKQDILKPRDYKIGFKIVRGAYYNQDKKYNILFDRIDQTHDNYNAGISLFSSHFKDGDKLLCATHNTDSIDLAVQYIKDKKLDNVIEFAQLMGMSDKQSHRLAEEKYKVYKYIPYGDFKDTLPYLIRRLYENYPMVMNIFK